MVLTNGRGAVFISRSAHSAGKPEPSERKNRRNVHPIAFRLCVGLQQNMLQTVAFAKRFRSFLYRYIIRVRQLLGSVHGYFLSVIF